MYRNYYRQKIQLDKTAKQIVKMMPDDERKSFDKVVAHLKKRFCPIDIAELSSIRNHREMTQSNSWVWICKLWEG